MRMHENLTYCASARGLALQQVGSKAMERNIELRYEAPVMGLAGPMPWRTGAWRNQGRNSCSWIELIRAVSALRSETIQMLMAQEVMV
jgi:hypothetical protein